jgi:hypothetical protein
MSNISMHSIEQARPLVLIPDRDYPAATTTYASDGTEREIAAAASGKTHVLVCGDFRLPADNSALVTVTIYSDDGSTETVHWIGYFDDAAKAGEAMVLPYAIYGKLGQALKWKAAGGGAVVRPNLFYTTY